MNPVHQPYKMKIKNKIIFAGLVFLLASCGVWKDFTTFFNTYYNARLNFEEAMEEINSQPRELFEFKEPTVTSKAKTSLNKVIEKCSKILQFDSESSYFDESLLIIGKSFYYQQEYLQAIRKFQELIALSKTDLKLEAKLWIGKTELQLRNFENGYKILDEVKAEAQIEENEEIQIDAYIAQIRYLINRENLNQAVNLSAELLSISESDERNAEITYEMGKIYLLLEDNENAALYFNKVHDYSPTFDIEFYSYLEFAKIQKELGNLEESKAVLEDLRSEDKYADFYDEIDFQIALIYYDENKIEDALDLFTEVDTVYSKKEAGGKSKFMRGEIMELVFADYDSAQKLYDKVPTSAAPRDFKNLASAKSINLRKYFDIKKDLDFRLAQMVYLTDNERFIEDSTWYFNWKNRDTTNLADLFNANKPKFNDEFLADSIRIQLDSIAVDTNYTAYQKDSLNYVLRGLRPPDKDLLPTTPVVQNVIVDDIEKPPFDYEPKRPKISEDSLKILIADSKLKMGDHFFTELNVPDSAYKYYNSIITEYDMTKYVPNAMFALGGYYDIYGNSVKADSLYRYVYDNYKNVPIVNEAAKKLKLPEIDFKSDPASDEYLIAEDFLINNKFDQAISSLLMINKTYPKSQYAAKSLYTIGWIYENELFKPDSAFFYYDSLIASFNKSDYAKAVRAKVSFYKSEEEKAKAVDSVQTVESLKPLAEGDNNAISTADSIGTSISQSVEGIKDSVKVSNKILVEDIKEDKRDQHQENLNSTPIGGSQRVYKRGRR